MLVPWPQEEEVRVSLIHRVRSRASGLRWKLQARVARPDADRNASLLPTAPDLRIPDTQRLGHGGATYVVAPMPQHGSAFSGGVGAEITFERQLIDLFNVTVHDSTRPLRASDISPALMIYPTSSYSITLRWAVRTAHSPCTL